MALFGSFNQSISGRKSRYMLCIGLFLVQSIICLPAAAQSPHFGLLCPNDQDKFFWAKVLDAAKAAANDLNVKLTISCGRDLSTYEFKKLGNDLLRSEPKLDYFITGYWKGVTSKHIELAHELGIKVFIFNADVFEEDYATVGQLPRQRYDNWIGHMVPNDTKAGADLAKILFDRAAEANVYGKDHKIHTISISGTKDNTVSETRTAGLAEQMRRTLQTEFVGNEYANWFEEPAYNATLGFLQKDPETSVIFVVADRMAVGALQAAKERNRKPGKDIFIGSFDWGMLDKLKTGEITASMGGHFLEAAWAIILSYDYDNGIDFSNDTGTRILTPLFPITSETIDAHANILGDVDWEKVDFKRFSKKLNPKLKTYNFDIKQFQN